MKILWSTNTARLATCIFVLGATPAFAVPPDGEKARLAAFFLLMVIFLINKKFFVHLWYYPDLSSSKRSAEEHESQPPHVSPFGARVSAAFIDWVGFLLAGALCGPAMGLAYRIDVPIQINAGPLIWLFGNMNLEYHVRGGRDKAGLKWIAITIIALGAGYALTYLLVSGAWRGHLLGGSLDFYLWLVCASCFVPLPFYLVRPNAETGRYEIHHAQSVGAIPLVLIMVPWQLFCFGGMIGIPGGY